MEKLGNITLYNCDCMEILKQTPDKYYSLCIVDPPYGIGASKQTIKPNRIKQKNGTYMNVKSTKYTQKEWDKQSPDNIYFDELIRVSKNQIIWGCNYYNYYFGSGRIVWDKLNGESDQLDCEIAYCSLNNRTDICYFMWCGMFQGMYCGRDISKATIQQGNKKLNELRIHPTQKPVQLYKWLLNKYAKEGDKILDTHLGSASSAIAAHDGGFEFTGIELDEEYYNSAKQRLILHQRQLNLF